MNKKRKKAYLSIVSVSIIYLTLIACIINDCIHTTQEYVNEYKLHIEKINNLEDAPIILAKEFMRTEYDKHWKALGYYGEYDAWRGNIDYELAASIIPGKGSTVFNRYNINDSEYNQSAEDADILIICKAYTSEREERDTKTVKISFTYNNPNSNIGGIIQYHGEKHPESVSFSINLIEGKYVADRTNLEELTGLTVEEIVEIAETNRKGFEDLMYAMKEHEPEESKKDLNSNLESSYAIAALLIVILLTLWITVLVAIIKSESGKKQILFHSRSDRGTEHEDKQKT